MLLSIVHSAKSCDFAAKIHHAQAAAEGNGNVTKVLLLFGHLFILRIEFFSLCYLFCLSAQSLWVFLELGVLEGFQRIRRKLRQIGKIHIIPK